MRDLGTCDGRNHYHYYHSAQLAARRRTRAGSLALAASLPPPSPDPKSPANGAEEVEAEEAGGPRAGNQASQCGHQRRGAGGHPVQAAPRRLHRLRRDHVRIQRHARRGRGARHGAEDDVRVAPRGRQPARRLHGRPRRRVLHLLLRRGSSTPARRHRRPRSRAVPPFCLLASRRAPDLCSLFQTACAIP